ncbi:MAG: hypothetical protein A4S09_12440 [Proteobacteria bacterium SG_bin7]|nr:MAG: hypothetical protein A4S09_12440 [Proteobacteria bacterium SG_bin7]
MHPLLTSTPVLLVLVTGAYFAVILPAIVIKFHTQQKGPSRPHDLWWPIFIFWPLGTYIYAILNIPRKLYAMSGFAGILWILFAVSVGVAALSHQRKDMKLLLTQCEDHIVKAKSLSKDQKADLNGSVMILKTEVKRTGIFEFEKQKRQQALVELLLKYLQNHEITAQEAKNWTEQYKKRNPASL